MSVKAMARVWELKLTPIQQTVLLAYADHADHDGGSIKCGIPLVAWKTGFSERHVRRVTQQLEKTGLLVVELRCRNKPTHYRINFEKGVIKEPYQPRAKPVHPDNLSVRGGDILTGQYPDNMSGQENSTLTSQGKEVAFQSDMASAKTVRIHQSTEPSINTKAAAAEARPNEFSIFENNIGILTPLIADAIKDALQHYPAQWVADAIREAALKNGRSWAYISSILKRWEKEGRQATRPAPALTVVEPVVKKAPPVLVDDATFRAAMEAKLGRKLGGHD